MRQDKASGRSASRPGPVERRLWLTETCEVGVARPGGPVVTTFHFEVEPGVVAELDTVLRPARTPGPRPVRAWRPGPPAPGRPLLAGPRGAGAVALALLLLLTGVTALHGDPSTTWETLETEAKRSWTSTREGLAQAVRTLLGQENANGDRPREPGPLEPEPLFPTSVVSLDLESVASAFVSHRNLAPGDRASGTLTLAVNQPTPEEAFTLRIRTVSLLEGAPPGVAARLDEALLVTRLAYAGEEWISEHTEGGRHTPPFLDVSGDGHVSVRELESGLDRLPAPKASVSGGSDLHVELRFEPPGGAPSEAFRGQRLEVRFVFELTEALGEAAP